MENLVMKLFVVPVLFALLSTPVSAAVEYLGAHQVFIRASTHVQDGWKLANFSFSHEGIFNDQMGVYEFDYSSSSGPIYSPYADYEKMHFSGYFDLNGKVSLFVEYMWPHDGEGERLMYDTFTGEMWYRSYGSWFGPSYDGAEVANFVSTSIKVTPVPGAFVSILSALTALVILYSKRKSV